MSKRVLIIFPGALGDLICLGPTLAVIAQRHPEAQVELMTRYELAEFAVGRLDIAAAHSIERREVALLFSNDPDRARSFFQHFVRIYCFFNSDDPQFRNALTEASAPGATTFHRFRPPTEGHVAAAYLKDATGRGNLNLVPIRLTPGDIEAASRAIAGIAEPKKYIAIFPGSGSPAKNWPLDKFCALANLLCQNIRAVFVLGPAEGAQYDKILRDAGHFVIKDQPLGVVAAIARGAAAFVGNDSGVSHLAATTGTAGLVLFGITEPERWRPLGRVTVMQRNPIDSIEVAEVMAAIEAFRIGI